jgi:hypothetical protein
MPVPFNEIVWGEFEALSVTVTLPVIVPVCDGANATARMQLAPGIMLAPAEQVVFEELEVKPALVTMLVMLIVWPLMFETAIF